MDLLLFSSRRARWRNAFTNSLKVSKSMKTPHSHRLTTSPSSTCKATLTISIYNTGIILIQGSTQHLEAFDKLFSTIKGTLSPYPPTSAPTTSFSPNNSFSITGSSPPRDTHFLPPPTIHSLDPAGVPRLPMDPPSSPLAPLSPQPFSSHSDRAPKSPSGLARPVPSSLPYTLPPPTLNRTCPRVTECVPLLSTQT